ncbi:hypothetical protein WDU94_002313 [Cyamophila willieti]
MERTIVIHGDADPDSTEMFIMSLLGCMVVCIYCCCYWMFFFYCLEIWVLMLSSVRNERSRNSHRRSMGKATDDNEQLHGVRMDNIKVWHFGDDSHMNLVKSNDYNEDGSPISKTKIHESNTKTAQYNTNGTKPKVDTCSSTILDQPAVHEPTRNTPNNDLPNTEVLKEPKAENLEIIVNTEHLTYKDNLELVNFVNSSLEQVNARRRRRRLVPKYRYHGYPNVWTNETSSGQERSLADSLSGLRGMVVLSNITAVVSRNISALN